MSGLKNFGSTDAARKTPRQKRLSDGFILTVFNVAVATFFVVVYFLSLLGMML